jgi:hypothetical protein
MNLNMVPNTTCDVYRTGNSPPAAPDVPALPINLQGRWEDGQAEGTSGASILGYPRLFTHTAHFSLTDDVRDRFRGGVAPVAQDTIYVPDQNGTPFLVGFIERVTRFQPSDHYLIYLDRQAPTWPTNNL